MLRPEVFAAYVADVLVKDDPALSQAWRSRSAEEVRNDPRFIAHKCGFDTQVILHISREAMKGMEPEIEEGPDMEFVLDDPESVSTLGDATRAYLREMGIETDQPPGDDKPKKPH